MSTHCWHLHWCRMGRILGFERLDDGAGSNLVEDCTWMVAVAVVSDFGIFYWSFSGDNQDFAFLRTDCNDLGDAGVCVVLSQTWSADGLKVLDWAVRSLWPWQLSSTPQWRSSFLHSC